MRKVNFVEKIIKVNYIRIVRSIHRRNIRFKNYVDRTNRKRVLGVSIDTSKSFHRVLIFNFMGEIKIPAFSINTLRSGYEELKSNIKKVARRIRAERVYISLESPANYTKNLISQLETDFGHVLVVAPYDVAQNRKQTTFKGLKTDDIDAGAVADLMLRGEYHQYQNRNSHLTRLNNLAHWREQKIKIRSILKNQIHNRFEKIFPGINCSFNGSKPLFRNPFESFIHLGLLNSNMTPRQILETSDDNLLKLLGYDNDGYIRYVQRLKKRINEMLLPPEKESKIDLKFLKLDMDILNQINSKICMIEHEITKLGSKTSAKYLFKQIKGINELYASIYVGLIGDFRRFKSAAHIYSYAGLSPMRRQSGGYDLTSIGIKRIGNRLLREILFRMAKQVVICEPYYMKYYNNLRIQKNKSWKESLVIISKKINKVMYALMRDKVNFSVQTIESP